MSLTYDQVVDKMMTEYSQTELFELCSESHKDQYGIRGRHMVDYTISELVSWWITHYKWNGLTQIWETRFEFNYD
ncbi:hypothetical protein [Polynucleobacter sp.]|uniref:hypothetical protein n=1 Tax=Polynucleobacter sp. TaxID=2029855 RepID=UPI003F6A1407